MDVIDGMTRKAIIHAATRSYSTWAEKRHVTSEKARNR